MSTIRTRFFSRLRQPEYTGENRCTPCTLVNLAITAVLGLAVGLAWPAPGAAFAAIGVAAVGVLAIYLRGYLVPGTPALTKRYFPDRVLRWFDKPPATTLETDVDAEAQLLAVGAVEPTDDGDDLRLTDSFGAAWEASIERTTEDLESRTATVLGLSEAEFRDTGAGLQVVEGGTVVARWDTHAALVADVAAMPLLRDRTTNWADLSELDQRRLLAGLRVFLETCPDCGGPLAFSEEAVKSCCRTREVVRYGCDDCGARLLEVEPEM